MRTGLLGCAVAFMLAGAGAGQCQLMAESGGFPGAVNVQGFTSMATGQVTCAARWDRDGGGPEPSWLVVGGSFNSIDSVSARNIAAYDGTQWRPIGAGLGTSLGSEVVYAITVYNGELYAGGRFLRSTGNGPALNGLARFDGTSWMPVGSGLPNASSNSIVHAFAELDGELFIGGGFGTFGSFNIARWNGSQWLPVYGGLGMSPSAPARAPIMALHVHQDVLYAAGSFQTTNVPGGAVVSIAQLVPGVGWQPVGTGLGGHMSAAIIQDLASDGPDLLAAGRMHGLSPNTEAQVARWNGQAWTPMLTTPSTLPINSVGRFQGDLFVGSDFQRLQRVNNGALEFVGPALSEPGSSTTSDFRKTIVLGEYAGGLLIGGNFMRTDTSDIDWRFLNSLAVWDGAAYSPLSAAPDRSISSFVRFNNDLYAVGTFLYANNQRCNRVARKSGDKWLPLGDGQGLNARAHCAAVWNNRLVVGGVFTTAGGQPAHCVAAWDGTAWEPLGAGVPEAGVRSLVTFNGDILAVCGNFTRITDTFTPTLRRWNGAEWVVFGNVDGSDADVGRPIVHDGQLYVARAGATGMLRWDGADWVPATQPAQPIYPVGVWQDALLGVGSGGTFRFVSGTWEKLSSATYGLVTPLEWMEHHGELYLGGHNGTYPVVMRWNGSTWISLANLNTGAPGTVGNHASALAVDDGQLMVGGALGSVLVTGPVTALHPAHAFIRTTPPQAPVFIDLPGASSAQPGDILTLHAEMLEPDATIYQWRREGVNLIDGVQADLSTVEGAATATLTIYNAAPSTSNYSLRATHTGSSCFAISAPVSVSVGQGCDPIDFNRDGLFPDTQDIADFLVVFAGGPCPVAGVVCGDIDFNNDGLYPDTGDITAIVTAMSGSCP